MKKLLRVLIIGIVLYVSIFTTACAQSKTKSDIFAEIKQYEWTNLYKHDDSYEEASLSLFVWLPNYLRTGKFSKSLFYADNDNSNGMDPFLPFVGDCFIPAYGGIYKDGIPIKNRDTFEECYNTTIEVLKTLHKEYIQMGIIQKKENQ